MFLALKIDFQSFSKSKPSNYVVTKKKTKKENWKSDPFTISDDVISKSQPQKAVFIKKNDANTLCFKEDPFLGFKATSNFVSIFRHY